MGEVKDPNLLAALNSGAPAPMNVQPQSFPGRAGMATGPTIQSPRMRGLDQADTRIGLDYNQDARANTSLQMDAERLRIAREKADADERARQANAGVDTTASQDQAVGHAIMLRDSLSTLNDVMSKAPDQVKPSWKEFGVQWLTKDDPTLTGLVQPAQRQRAANAYRGAVESAIWLMTGAAAPADQVQRIYSNIAPTASDGPELLADKRRRLLTFIEQAEARAGAAQLKIDGTKYSEDDLKALGELKSNLNLIYGDEKAAAPDKPTLSGNKMLVPVPQGMNEEHLGFLNNPAHARGKLTVGDYLNFYQGLQKKYDYGNAQTDYNEVERFVNAYNKGEPVDLNIHPYEKELDPLESMIAETAKSPGGTFAKNAASAMTLGAPELLAGKEGRMASALADEENPNAAMLGEMVGSVAPGLGLEALASKGLIKLTGKEAASRTARLGGDMLGNAALGGVTELNQTGDAGDALAAAAGGAGGAALGRGVAKGFSEFKPKEFRESMDMLGPQDIFDDAGKKVGSTGATDMTTLQRAGGERAEEFFEGLPGIAGQRQKAMDSWNLHNTAQTLARVGHKLPKNVPAGQAANKYVHAVLGDEYNKIAPSIKGIVDGDFAKDLVRIRNDALKPPGRGKPVPDDVKEMWQYLEDAAANLKAGPKGEFDYDSYKRFAGQVREWQRFWASSKIGTDEIPSPIMNQMARRAEDLLTAGRALVSRANPAAGARLKKIDTAYRHQMVNDIASLSAGAMKNRGVAAPEDWLNAVKRMDFSKGQRASAEGEAFGQKYGNAAMEVMGKRPSRGGSIVGTTALGYTLGGSLLSPALIAAYAPGFKRVTQTLTGGNLKKLDKLTPEAFQKEFPELPTDVIKQLMATYIREKATGK